MAFLRFNRDTRGYEHFYLVQPTTNRRGKVRSRILYWFRTPPNVKVGRQPFDDAVRRALEAQNPDIQFDWRAILDTPIPAPVEVERWRERRRFDRAARQAAAEEAISDLAPDAAGVEPTGPVTHGVVDGHDVNDAQLAAPSDAHVAEASAGEQAANSFDPARPSSEPAPDRRGEPLAPAVGAARFATDRRRRRRRRGWRSGQNRAASADEPASPEPGAQVRTDYSEPSERESEPSEPEKD